MRDHRVRSGEIELAVRERGEEHEPAVVLVHGYPDTSAMWDEVAERLAGRFRVIAYDVRGAGASTAPEDPLDYRLEALAGDLAAVIDALSPDRPVHLVGHDWGSVQGWEAVTGDRLAGRIASFTSLSGPCLDHGGQWARERLRSGPRGMAAWLVQARRSWYAALLVPPGLGELTARRIMPRAVPYGLRMLEGVRPRAGHPADTLHRDLVNGLGIYRANLGRTRRPRDRRTDVPVQIVLPARERYATQEVLLTGRDWVERCYVRRLPAGHWLPRTHPDKLAGWIAEFAEHVEGGPRTAALARARQAGEPGKEYGGRLVVVTGAGSGIGRAAALAFAAAGGTVVVADIDEDAARRTAAEIAAAGGTAQVYRVDVADPDGMRRFADFVLETRGVPDVVVNNAGIGIGGPLLDTGEDDWRRITSVNLDGVYRGCRLFGRQMADRGEGGHLVNIASMAAYIPSSGLGAYSATKAAVLQLSECLRLELEPAGVGVSAICPGLIETPIVRNFHVVGMDPAAADRLRERVGQVFHRRGYRPEKVAAAILRAVRHDIPVLPVAPEARAGRALSRISPATGRAVARLVRRMNRSEDRPV